MRTATGAAQQASEVRDLACEWQKHIVIFMVSYVTGSTRFSDLPWLGVEVEVTCQKCGKVTVIDGRDKTFDNRLVAGARYRCSEPGCGGIGRPTLEKRR